MINSKTIKKQRRAKLIKKVGTITQELSVTILIGTILIMALIII